MQGFIPGSRGSFMLDFVSLAMVAILPTLTYSIYLVRVKKAYAIHRRVQLAIGAVLAVAVLLFELELRLSGWRHLATPSPYYDTILFPFLAVHLLFAISTSLLWIITIYTAIKYIPDPPGPCAYSRQHKRLGWAAAIGMYCTSITGWTFYWLAFVA